MASTACAFLLQHLIYVFHSSFPNSLHCQSSSLRFKALFHTQTTKAAVVSGVQSFVPWSRGTTFFSCHWTGFGPDTPAQRWLGPLLIEDATGSTSGRHLIHLYLPAPPEPAPNKELRELGKMVRKGHRDSQRGRLQGMEKERVEGKWKGGIQGKSPKGPSIFEN